MLGSWATLTERSKNEVHDNIELLLYIFQSQTQFEQSSTLSNSNYIKVSKIYLLTFTLEATQNLDDICRIRAYVMMLFFIYWF